MEVAESVSSAGCHVVGPHLHKLECGCGAVSVLAFEDPQAVYVCACADCQKGSGSAFAWRVRFARSAVQLVGEPSFWRRSSEAGRWVEQAFCSQCGTGLYMGAEAMPDHIVVSASCFVGESGPPPTVVNRANDMPSWCSVRTEQ